MYPTTAASRLVTSSSGNATTSLHDRSSALRVLPSDDIVALLLHAANTGVPLTSKEVRWIHSRLEAAWSSYCAPGNAATYKVFDPSTPNGTYPFDPPGSAMSFSDIALVLGSCASPYRNPTGRPIVDCKRLLAAFP